MRTDCKLCTVRCNKCPESEGPTRGGGRLHLDSSLIWNSVCPDGPMSGPSGQTCLRTGHKKSCLGTPEARGFISDNNETRSPQSIFLWLPHMCFVPGHNFISCCCFFCYRWFCSWDLTPTSWMDESVDPGNRNLNYRKYRGQGYLEFLITWSKA